MLASILVDINQLFNHFKDITDMYDSLYRNLRLWTVTSNESSFGKIGQVEARSKQSFIKFWQRLAMDIIIACNKQLPIRYYPNDGVWVRRGRHFSDRTLPFFVEIEVTNHIACVCEYIVEIERQYKTFEMEVIIKNEQWQQVLIENLPYGHHINGRIYIIK